MSLMSTGMSICSISSTCKKLLILYLIAISIVLFVYHLIIFPVLTVKENPVRAFLPVVFIVTLSTFRSLLRAVKIIFPTWRQPHPVVESHNCVRGQVRLGKMDTVSHFFYSFD